MKTKVLPLLLAATLTGYSQIPTINRNIKDEINNVDATNLNNQTLNNTYNSRTLLTKIANKSKKGQINSTWTKHNEKDVFRGAISIPKIAFPGYVKVTLTENNAQLKPHLVITPDLNKPGAIISGGSGSDNPTRTAYFSVYPGRSYDVVVYPFFNATLYDPPIPYKIEWEYTGQKDIYEPNNTRAEAKNIEFNKPLSAFAIAGHIRYAVGAYDENTYDWYSVVLKEDKKIKVSITDKPSDINLVMRIFDSYGKVVGTVTGYNSITASKSLSKGTYFIEVHPRLKNGAARTSTNSTKPVPQYFNKPYKFTVTKI